MKKLLFLTAAAAVAFSSCTKDQTEVVSIESKDGVRISASMVESTRTYLGDDKFYHWSKGDALGVFVKDNANNAKNVAFTLDPIYDGQINGEFVSNNTDLLDAATEEFFAYYPHTPGMKAEDVLDLDLQVLSEQNYQPGTFATLTAPSVADDFTLAEPVEMQPVADYLKVRINGVEDINYLTLAIKYNGGWLNLTDVELKKYLVKANANVKDEDEDAKARYALVPKSFEGTPAEIPGTPGTPAVPGTTCDNDRHYYVNWGGQWVHDNYRHPECAPTEGTPAVPGTDDVVNNPTSTITLNCGRLDETVVCHNAGFIRSKIIPL